MMTTVETQYLAVSCQNPYYPFEGATYFKLSESGLQISFLVSRERNIGEPLNQFCRQSLDRYSRIHRSHRVYRIMTQKLLNQRLSLKDGYSAKSDSTLVRACKAYFVLILKALSLNQIHLLEIMYIFYISSLKKYNTKTRARGNNFILYDLCNTRENLAI